MQKSNYNPWAPSLRTELEIADSPKDLIWLEYEYPSTLIDTACVSFSSEEPAVYEMTQLSPAVIMVCREWLPYLKGLVMAEITGVVM